MSPEAVIDISGLTKSYGKFQALKGLDLQVTRGEVHGFLGGWCQTAQKLEAPCIMPGQRPVKTPISRKTPAT